MSTKKPRALSLISGGLDSMLATRVILDQGVLVEGINFFTGFTGDCASCFSNTSISSSSAKLACDRLGIKLHVVDVFESYKDILNNPTYGYGANLNPCLDCKLFMIVQAKNWAITHGYDFLITGEVLGQRPKSQRKDTLPLASKLTGDLVLRPLSAKLLEPTLPEKNGWIDRELLHGFSGRGRKNQLDLAAKLGIKEFPQPAGGCVLTDKNFCKRLKDLWSDKDKQKYSIEDVMLMKVGRHLRIRKNLKVIVGRNEEENKFMENLMFGRCTLLQSFEYPGALLVVDGKYDQEELKLIAGLAGYFSKGRELTKPIKILLRPEGVKECLLEALPLVSKDMLQKWYV